MAYNQFTLKQLRNDYQLEIGASEALYAEVPSVAISSWLTETLAKQTGVALRSRSEKARSEYIIAPILLEVYDQLREKVNFFSGVEFNVDASQGLTGYCDFLYTLSPRTPDILAPVISVVEAKKEDIINGIPQCLAELVAAQIFNAAENSPIETLYGVVTNGEVWKFLSLRGIKAAIDTDEYFLNEPDKIVGIIMSMLS